MNIHLWAHDEFLNLLPSTVYRFPVCVSESWFNQEMSYRKSAHQGQQKSINQDIPLVFTIGCMAKWGEFSMHPYSQQVGCDIEGQPSQLINSLDILSGCEGYYQLQNQHCKWMIFFFQLSSPKKLKYILYCKCSICESYKNMLMA